MLSANPDYTCTFCSATQPYARLSKSKAAISYYSACVLKSASVLTQTVVAVVVVRRVRRRFANKPRSFRQCPHFAVLIRDHRVTLDGGG